jgi:hypothetical protein
MSEVTCETQGHLWGYNGLCVMCKTPKPAEPLSSKPLVQQMREMASESMPEATDLLLRGADEIERLRAALEREKARQPTLQVSLENDRLRDENEALRRRLDFHRAANSGGVPADETPDVSSQMLMDPNICGDDGPISPEDCALWLDKKYSRHGELEDRAAAMWLRKLACRAASKTGDGR